MSHRMPGALLAFALLAGLSSRSPVSACFCEPLTFEAHLAQADAVFRGVVTNLYGGRDLNLAILRVTTVWKGPVAGTMTVLTPAGGDAACGFPFREGGEYIVFAADSPSEYETCEVRLETDSCTLTQPFDESLAEMLGAPLWTVPFPFLRGDVNEDGAVDISDAVKVLLVLFRGENAPYCADGMDWNDDGDVNITDPIFGLEYLFRGGPEPPSPGPDLAGFDGTPGDPFPCGDPPGFECDAVASSDLPGVRIEVLDGPCALTAGEAEAGVTFVFRLVVEQAISGVTFEELGTCQQPGPGGALILPDISGGGQRYCICDGGLCPPTMHTVDLGPGSWVETFDWCGRNWFGPSDFFPNPLGPPFPPGRYTFRARARGSYVDGGGAAVPFEMSASHSVEILP